MFATKSKESVELQNQLNQFQNSLVSRMQSVASREEVINLKSNEFIMLSLLYFFCYYLASLSAKYGNCAH